MIPQKLKFGDEVRILAIARSLGIISKENREIAKKRFDEMGLKLTFGKNAEKKDIFNSSSIEERISDFHEAIKDSNVKAIFTVIGGFNSNQLLRYIDYKLVEENPKIICGFSDITALQNAILRKTGLVTYSGPHYSSFAMKKGFEYTLEYLKKCLIQNEPILIKSSFEWSDDSWYMDQEKRDFIKNKGFIVINTGNAEGRILGANLCTFNLLQGTEYMPSLKDSILFIEDDETSNPLLFDRDLQSLIHQPEFDKVRGIVIGRFQKNSKMDEESLKQIIKTKKELQNIPVIAGVDFGHTTPIITFPIGGKARLISEKGKSTLEILDH